MTRHGVTDSRIGLRTIALFEAAKGLVVLLAGSGLLLLVHRDVQAMAEQLVSHLHLDPAKRYPRIFLHIVTGATPARLRLLALGALPSGNSPDEFAAFIKAETEKWAKVAKAAHIRLD